jgi:uncharacterized protein YbaR (Trm112 family)
VSAAAGAAGDGGLDPRLLEIIVCPNDRGDLDVVGAGEVELVCRSCGFAYPVRDGIPVLLVDDARRPA